MTTPSGGALVRVASTEAVGGDDSLVGEVQQRLTELAEGLLDVVGDLLMGTADFVWEQATLVRYEDTQDQVVIVPGAQQHQSPTERVMLMAPHRPGDGGVRGACLQIFERDNDAVTDRFRVHFADPGRGRMVGMSVDESRNEVTPIVHQQPQARSQGYWSCVGACLRDGWDQLPWPIVWLCGGGCGACVFGGNPYGCAACVGCLGGYAAGCLARCA